MKYIINGCMIKGGLSILLRRFNTGILDISENKNIISVEID